MARKIGVGVVGLGFMGRMHFGNCRANPKCRVVAVADTDPQKLRGDWGATGGNIGRERAGLADLAGIRGYSRIEDLIADPGVELVIITLPSFLHAEHAIKALAAGKHVLCEKPITTDLASARRVVAAARRSKGRLMVAQCLRFWPEYAWAREHAVAGREFGRVISASFRRLSATPGWSWSNWIIDSRRRADAANELHIHDADMVRYMFGEPEAVWARGAVGVISRNVVDHLTAHYRYPGMKSVSAEGGWAFAKGFGFEMSFILTCERATVVYDNTQKPTLTVHRTDGRSLVPKFKAGDAYALELDYFLDCIRAGRAPRVITPADAARSLALVLAEVKSVEAGGRWVKV
jgi:1,5-anhydro-D-fructose reductase (1,5-anhydro-D-mannitol-forming)